MSYENVRTHEVGREPTDQAYRPSTAPKWDVLQLHRLKNIAELGLDYRTQPVLIRQDAHYAIFIIGLIGLLSMLLNMAGSLTSRYLDTPFILALLSAVSILVGLHSFFTDRSKWVAGVYALVGPGAWMIAVLPGWVHRYPMIGYGLFLASLGLVCYLAQRIANHYAKWLSASPQLLGEQRKKANEKWENRHYEGAILMLGYGAILILCAGTPILGFSAFLAITFLFAVGLVYRATGFKEVGKTCTLCWAAIVSWLTYHRYQAVHFDFVDQRPNKQYLYDGMSAILRLAFSGLILLFIFYIFFPKDVLHGEVGHTATTTMMLMFFLVVAKMIYDAFYAAYDLNGTVFPHPVSPPGLFRSPGGSWIIRNLLTAIILGALFISTIHFIAYAPLGLVSSPVEPLFAAFHRVVENKLSLTTILAHLAHYQPPTAANIVEHLSIGEVLLLQKADAETQQQFILSQQLADYLKSSPGAWLSLIVDSAFMGEPQAIWTLLLSVLQCFLFPIALFLMSCLAVFGRTLPYYARMLDGLKSSVPDWQGYAERLRNSPVLEAREHLWLGVHATEDYPILLHRSILGEHAHFLGDSGSGKTALGMAPVLAQLIRAQDSAIVIIDLKGDMPLFQTAKAGAGARFKFFTNEVEKASYVFNPFAPLSTEYVSLNQVCEVFLSALGLDHGEGYGRSYYSRIARNLLSRTIQEYPDIASFEELREKIGKLSKNQGEEQDAFELITVVESLAVIPQLNYAGQDPVTEQSINMKNVVKNREVVYFWLPAAIETASVREIAKLALHTLFTSAYQHQRQAQETPKVWVFVDEFQHIASLNFQVILQQARSMGLGMILANQADSDLWSKEVNLKATVQSNTRFKQIFSMSNPQEREELGKASGETIYYSRNRNAEGLVTEAHERLGPRLMVNDIIALSDEPDTSIVLISRGEGYSQFGGYAFPVRSRHHITLEEYQRRQHASWPRQSVQTLVARRRRRGETGPSPEAPPLHTVYILSDDEAPPAVSEKVASSSWAKHLEKLYQARG